MTVEKREFKTEVKQLLDLMVHSLYSHKEVFLRELISNASDAIDRARYESLQNSALLEGDAEWKIRLTIDKEARTLTISDNGIGMTKDESIEALGTIAHSGTKEFLQALQSREVQNNPELIGQFGVGFYSSLMVADKITVISRKAGQPATTGVKWESTGDGTFTIEDIEKPGRGTDVTLHLKEEEKQYLEEWEIRTVVKKYSDFIEHPVVMEVEKETESSLEKGKKVKVKEDETLNSMKAIWLKDKAAVTDEEHNEFYKHIARDFLDPLKVIHYRAEGVSEFNALLYLPSKAPFNILYKDYKVGPTLYVKRVQIMDHCEELIPPYLRFVRGVVDSSDLPLNVSREILQNNRLVETIKTSITKKVLDVLEETKRDEPEKYREFHKEFGRILKEGIHYDFSRRETIADLLLFPSTKTEGDNLRTLQEYVDAMKEGQDAIYYITGANLKDTLKSPYLEAFREKDYEVLVFLDDIDDFVMSNLEFKGKKLKSVLRGDIDLDNSEKADIKKEEKKYRKLLDLIRDSLKDEVKDVRFSGRLTDSPCCLVADENDIDPQMEKMLKAMGQEVPPTRKILEINQAHPLLEAMNTLFEKDKDGEPLKEYISLLYDQALVLQGSQPKDPVAFSRMIARLMVEGAENKK
ncbi:MAG: molecular chaperone HtpG [Syntrophus sp. (in: bacteria)]|nr:molecular chaperone HtpG [Syntrophus sp. (in: bacteria)]